MSDLRDKLDAIADATSPPVGMRRDAEIARAIDAGLGDGARAARSRDGRRTWPWFAIGGALAAAAALALWIQLRAPDGVRLEVESGAIDAPQVGEIVEVPGGAPAVVRTPDGTRVEAHLFTRFAREDADASRWRLERGQLWSRVTKRAPGKTFEVVTEEATVTVVGTQFTVDRYVIDGAATTYVQVQEGIVRVTPIGGAPVLLHAGEHWPADIDVVDLYNAGMASHIAAGELPRMEYAPIDAGVVDVDAAIGDVVDAALAQTETDARTTDVRTNDVRTEKPARLDAATIRTAIRAGRVDDARKLIDDSRKTYAGSRRALAELGILAAELDLAERNTRSAIDKYLAVVRDYASTPQAEQALFAAAQLAIDRPDAGYKPEALLRDYLDAYPKGQFAKDAQRLLDSRKN